MPRVFTPVDISQEEKEVRKDYFDRHTPRIVTAKTAKRNQKLKVKVIVGEHYEHPDVPEHYISYIQLWNRETFLAEAHFTPGMLGNQPSQVEVDFYIVPKQTMNLAAMAVCTNHGLWQSESMEIRVID
ncbi:MAG: hypothetical protein K9H49_19560 [Bacteroidales bacterium]|nr:hypothetical protein [Bacteroidales bacterium]MCF8406074.1 hypothetical protein [Bacteroidales bacterium]